ncbi:hypothetical protein [Streptomyces sp. CBMA152]|uniref:hypothetical protein n=1 Tax=Streptomyces sp. CBMA152 TaxID=1896312 RepID=UPI001660B601|nr:hypothetical protein [Streptomyces sp. CBMA152]MBD0743559.1 hypothetical protein [Streptomyces sp. CBMA152]
MGTAIVSAVGVLAGAAMAVFAQYAMHATSRRDAHREEVKEALVWVLGAAAAHRGEQYQKIQAQRDDIPDTPEARRLRYAAHTAVTDGMTALTVATDDRELLRLAGDLVGYSFALGEVPDEDVKTVGDQARDAHNELQAAARYIHQHA